MSSEKVFVTKNDDINSGIFGLLDNIELPDLSEKKILLKPNLGRQVNSGTGIITDIKVISAIIDFFKYKGFNNLFLGDSPVLGYKAFDIYEKIGLTKLAKEKKVTLLDFDREKPAVIEIKNGLTVNNLKIYKHLSEYDFLVSIPVMKTHMHTVVSLSLKNLKGLLWRNEKVRLHQLAESDNPEFTDIKPLDIAISDLAMCIKPDLAVIDGSTGLEGLGPLAGQPKKAGLFVASKNFLFADVIAAQLMGFNPLKINHIYLSLKRSGISKLDNISVSPVNYLDYRVDFKPAPDKISIDFPNVKVKESQACSACMSTLMLFLQTYAGQIKYNKFPDGCISIRVGKGEVESDSVDILLGNCTKKYCREGNIFIKGCPPVSSGLFKTLSENGLIHGNFAQNN